MRYMSILVAGLTLAVGGFADDYSVSKNELQNLLQTAKELKEHLVTLEKQYDNRDIIPSAQDRRAFREAVATLQEEVYGDNKSLLAQLRRIRKDDNGGGGGGGGNGGGNQSLELGGFFAVGKTDSTDQSEASKSLAKECDKIEAEVKATFGSYFDVFQCGEPTNVTQWPTINYKKYLSKGTVYLVD